MKTENLIIVLLTAIISAVILVANPQLKQQLGPDIMGVVLIAWMLTWALLGLTKLLIFKKPFNWSYDLVTATIYRFVMIRLIKKSQSAQ
jgi:hypothetical protein